MFLFRSGNRKTVNVSDKCCSDTTEDHIFLIGFDEVWLVSGARAQFSKLFILRLAIKLPSLSLGVVLISVGSPIVSFKAFALLLEFFWSIMIFSFSK